MLSLQKILDESLWVAKMQGYRKCGTYAEIGDLADSEDCRDFDLAATQPEDLMDFYDGFFKHRGFITIQDYYHNFYAKGVAG